MKCSVAELKPVAVLGADENYVEYEEKIAMSDVACQLVFVVDRKADTCSDTAASCFSNGVVSKIGLVFEVIDSLSQNVLSENQVYIFFEGCLYCY